MSAQQTLWEENAPKETQNICTTTWDAWGTGAAFSPCRTWRYALWRVWNVHRSLILVVALNPSTATERDNDPTVKRCIVRAMMRGHGGLLLGNLFAYRSTDPKALRTLDDPVGPENMRWLIRMADSADTIVCAWGTHGTYRHRDLHTRRRLDNVGQRFLWCWGKTKSGQPKHPLYLPYTTPLELY